MLPPIKRSLKKLQKSNLLLGIQIFFKVALNLPFKPQSFGGFHVAVILPKRRMSLTLHRETPEQFGVWLNALLGAGIFPRLISKTWRMHSHCYLCSHLCLNLSCKLQTALAVQSLAFPRAVRTLQELDDRGKAASRVLRLTVPIAGTPCSGQAKQSKHSANTRAFVLWADGTAHAQSGATGKQSEVPLIPGNQAGFLPVLTQTPTAGTDCWHLHLSHWRDNLARRICHLISALWPCSLKWLKKAAQERGCDPWAGWCWDSWWRSCSCIHTSAGSGIDLTLTEIPKWMPVIWKWVLQGQYTKGKWETPDPLRSASGTFNVPVHWNDELLPKPSSTDKLSLSNYHYQIKHSFSWCSLNRVMLLFQSLHLWKSKNSLGG